MDKPGLIYRKITQAMADIKAISKDQYNSAQRFKYRGIEDIYKHVKPVLVKHGIFTTAEIIGRERSFVETKNGGKAVHAITHFKFRFFAEDGSYVDAYADGEAKDSGDKAANKCASVAHKYALIQTFCIPTAGLEDPDAHSPESYDAPSSEKSLNDAFGGF